MRTKGSFKKILSGVILHSGLLWAALSLGYNLYKEYMRVSAPLSREMRHSIKAVFPEAILIFSVFYLIFCVARNRSAVFLGLWQYIFALSAYAVVLNLLLISKGADFLVPFNLSSIFFPVFVSVSFWASNYVKGKNVSVYPPVLSVFIKEKPSAPFIAGFAGLLILCSFLLAFKEKKIAEAISNFAYLLLIAGVGIEVYGSVKSGGGDGEKD